MRGYTRVDYCFLSVKQNFVRLSGKCTANTGKYDDEGKRSYGTNFEILGCDSNILLLPFCFAHTVGPYCLEKLTEVFNA